MKTLKLSRLGAIALVFCAHAISAMAITFTHDAFISFADLSNEGQDIVVTNCTLTVDGTHAFNSLQVLNGAVVTHSPLPYGPQQFVLSVFSEPQVLSSNGPVTLNNTNIESDTIIVTDTTGSIFYTANVDYIVTISNQFTQLTLTTNSAIASGATVLVDYDWAEEFQGFNLAISHDVNIAAGGAINVSGKGYTGGIGFPNGAGGSHATNFPFVFTAGGGAGHGGSGGMSSTSARSGGTYDSTTNPGNLGSGGGTGSADGGAGGGVAALVVGGNLQIDGRLVADGFKGTNTHSGGGSGGSILISAGGFSGAGAISANGGSGDLPDGGGGGGGRIAIYFPTNNFTGTIAAFGGGGSTAGGAGTIYLQSSNNPAGQLFIVNGGKRGTNTTFSTAAISDLTISGGAITQPPFSILLITNLFIGSNSWLTSPDSLPLVVNVNGDATLEPNATVNADLKSLTGPGAGSGICAAGSGGGYGGFGGASVCGAQGGMVYGSISQPSALGSPGGAGPILSTRGGGAIQMTVAGTLSLAGNVSANGGSTSSLSNGGGSGGSVWLTVGTLTGNGAISANGGSANKFLCGGGGGGRVAVYFTNNLFSGSITARGGAGTNNGGAGTIYLKSSSDPIPQLIVDNGGLAGTTALTVPLSMSDLTITGGAVLTNNFSPPTVLRTLFIGSNSWLTAMPFTSISMTASNATIQSSGGIIADGMSNQSVPGHGQTVNLTGGGGGNGGNGGASWTNAAGGNGTGMVINGTNPGGVGGNGIGLGGFGGGIINLAVPGVLQMDGLISANGQTGPGFNSGGGAGGGIRIQSRTISGSGIISANGGAANNLGGGGGGGDIALFRDTNFFSGTVTATGGSGANYGGAGTINLGDYLASFKGAQLIVDNGGNRGAKTPLSVVQDSTDLSITGGAVVSNIVSTTLPVRNLLIGSNSALQTYPSFQQSISVASNATILAGGSLNADGLNTIFTSIGQGQTLNSSGGGGASAGSGGASALNAAGGIAFSDSISSPTSLGGRGGMGLFNQNQGDGGGAGGGSFRLTVGGTLRVDGRISAEGATGASLNSGGGAGGSMVVSAKVLSGSGVISANGAAANGGGGGGGGGHIAISYTANLFTGNTTARGGGGANYGGAGIIYTSSNPAIGPIAIVSQVILDNGGVRGASTPFFSNFQQGNFSLTVTGGATLTNSFGMTVQNLFIGSNSTWLAFSPSPLAFTVLTNATIQAGGVLFADGSSPQGPSPGQSITGKGGGGGGHGGYGGASLSNAPGGNVTSDLIPSPVGLGSAGGGPGGGGGGALQITVRGALQLDGRISANGVTGSVISSGGGAGGSVWLSVGKFSGAGGILANGGAGNLTGGGGGGGRIAIWYNTNLFSGGITARGGAGGHYGGAGTIYTTSSFFGEGKSTQLIVDNGGANGTNTFIGNSVGGDFVIGNGASVTLSSAPMRWNSLTVSSNGSVGLDSTVTTGSLTTTSNLTIQTGGVIALDGQGFKANLGAGHGLLTSGGAGHGGLGSLGSQTTGITSGGLSYDTIVLPTLPGSGGGSTSQPSVGSEGGGALQLNIGGTLAVNGNLSANGKSGIASGSGGGSGGSLWLNATTISGTGKISVDGGDGELFGGGGGGAGGRIAGYFNTNQFTGTLSARGGAGVTFSGGAGTVYLKTNNTGIAQLILDNNGQQGTNTPLDSVGQIVGLTIRNGATANSANQLTLQNLSIGAGGLFNAGPLSRLTLTVLGNALVDTNGAINVDADGYNPLFGIGNGGVDFFGDGSGGGYGGTGGTSFFGTAGGFTYGSSNQPIDFGSAGGVSPVLAGYSQGGGAVRLTVNGALTVNGSISANGNGGFIAGSGGGAGGSIWITTQRFAGNGFLTANGGAGESGEGGGGGGGRIAIYAGTNSFAGGIFASGGTGAFPAQDGTIYIPTAFLISGNVTDTNGTAVPGITLQPSGLSSVVSNINGAYSVTVPPIWSGSITPSGNGIIIPSARTYSNLSANTPNQDFIVTVPSAFNLNGGSFDGTNVNFTWYGINGVTYQVYYSSDLVNWIPYGVPILGNNAAITFAAPPTNAPQMYFRLSVRY